MEIAEIRFLAEGEVPALPSWSRLLPAAWRREYLLSRRPYRLEREGIFWEAVLQTQRENILSVPWRKAALALLEELRQEGAAIVIPPAEGEFPREKLPFAEGRRLAALFAFAGGTEALRRRGKEPAEAKYLIAGGGMALWKWTMASLGNEVNHLGIFTANREEGERLAERLYRERGLSAEVFSSAKNPYFAEADVILSCGMEQRCYEHILKKGCFWLDLAGNRPTLRRLRELRPDIAAAEGFFFQRGEEQLEGRKAEALAFVNSPSLQKIWNAAPEEGEGELLLGELLEMGFSLSGFSALGKRVKIAKNQGKKPFLPGENNDNLYYSSI